MPLLAAAGWEFTNVVFPIGLQQGDILETMREALPQDLGKPPELRPQFPECGQSCGPLAPRISQTSECAHLRDQDPHRFPSRDGFRALVPFSRWSRGSWQLSRVRCHVAIAAKVPIVVVLAVGKITLKIRTVFFSPNPVGICPRESTHRSPLRRNRGDRNVSTRRWTTLA